MTRFGQLESTTRAGVVDGSNVCIFVVDVILDAIFRLKIRTLIELLDLFDILLCER